MKDIITKESQSYYASYYETKNGFTFIDIEQGGNTVTLSSEKDLNDLISFIEKVKEHLNSTNY